MIQAAEELAESVGVSDACRVLGVPRSSLYRARRPKLPPAPRPSPRQALSQEEKETTHQVLNSERFWDCSPRQVYATLLDEGIYLCHWRTMYRILDEDKEVRERRNQLQHPPCIKPELLATGPNQLWSWDITKLKGPVKWTYYYLYVILDVFSRYVVGWMVAERELARLARELIAETCIKENIAPDQLIIHADRGSSMRSKSVAQLLADLGVTKSHSRPYTPNDNPYSEAQFKTMKYRPGFPDRFGSLADVRAWARPFFHWYNHEHHHTGLGLMTPSTVHHGHAETVYAQRQQVLEAAYAAHPERFARGMPTPPKLPSAVWINRSQSDETALATPDPRLAGAQAPSSESKGQPRPALGVEDDLATMRKAVEQLACTYSLDSKLAPELSQNA